MSTVPAPAALIAGFVAISLISFLIGTALTAIARSFRKVEFAAEGIPVKPAKPVVEDRTIRASGPNDGYEVQP